MDRAQSVGCDSPASVRFALLKRIARYAGCAGDRSSARALHARYPRDAYSVDAQRSDEMTATDEQAIRDTIEAFYQAFSEKDVAKLRRVVTHDWEYIPEPPGAVPGPEQMNTVFANIASALPDMQVHILDVLIHGDRVGVRAEVTGTQTGQLLGIAATSRQVHFAIHSFHQLQNGLIAKTWHLEDWLAVFRQLGELPTHLDLR
jgi:predicted ester cyclase